MSEPVVPADRLPRWMRAGGEKGLPLERARLRIAAYVYGTILVLASVATQSRETIDDGHAAVAVAATTGTTLLAHPIAPAVAQRLGSRPGELRLHLAQEARDSMPIVVAGAVPIVVMILASIDLLDTRLAQVIAGGWLVLRLTLLGPRMSRATGSPVTRASVWAGVGLAVVSSIVVALKATLLH